MKELNEKLSYVISYSGMIFFLPFNPTVIMDVKCGKM
jgi:hypothetical protein